MRVKCNGSRLNATNPRQMQRIGVKCNEWRIDAINAGQMQWFEVKCNESGSNATNPCNAIGELQGARCKYARDYRSWDWRTAGNRFRLLVRRRRRQSRLSLSARQGWPVAKAAFATRRKIHVRKHAWSDSFCGLRRSGKAGSAIGGFPGRST